MHISEGVLSGPVLVAGGVVTTLGTTVGLKTLDYDRIMTVALLTATFFVASLIHVPIGPGNVHLVLTGLLGILLGWSCFPTILTALLLQSLFFSFGGLTVLGVNTMNMALPALLCHYLFRKQITKGETQLKMASFGAGFLAIFLSALMMAASLALTDGGFSTSAGMIVAAHLPVMVLEGFITMFTVAFLAKVQPDFIFGETP